MRKIVAVLDADVLVPILSCDLLLTAFDSDIYLPVVAPRILDEVEHNLIADLPRLDPYALARRAQHVRTALEFHTQPDAEITDAVAVVNPKDRHVAALALASGADVVATNDRRLRGELQDLEPPLPGLTADDFAVRLLDRDGDEMRRVLDVMVAKRRRRPITRDDLVAQLSRTFPAFAAAIG